MQEQPPSDPPRREPATGARRSRSPKPTFAAPPTPEPPAPPARQPEAESGSQSRARRAKAAPAVLFQPPDPTQAVSRTSGHSTGDASEEGHTRPAGTAAPRPRPATGAPRTPAAEGTATEASPAAEGTATEAARTPGREGTATEAGPRAVPTGERAEPVGTGPDPVQRGSETDEEAPKPTRRAPAKKATPAKKAVPGKKTSPAARKRAEAAPAKASDEAGDGGHTDRGPAGKAAAPRQAGTRAATPKKAAPAKKATAAPPVEIPTQPGPATVAVRAVDAAEPASGRTAGVEWRAITARVVDHPAFAPELLALAAVDALGPRAGEWAGRLRGTYPEADADGLARLATRRFVRLAGTGGAVAAGAGLFAPVAELAAVLWTQANLVLHLAAAYDRDPAHPDRAAELLVLTQVHPDAESADAALDAARAADGPGERPWPRAAEAAWRLATPLAAQAGGWLGLRLASRLLPGAAVLAAAAGDAAAAERLAARAIATYRRPRVPSR
ncbi:hypothetical protein [Micromonospora inositola]|uniref:EcsC protein family protein n=1 Tax=Micromonospora inositola TaxID=47865 RepID=A0A1C5HZ87_9ACTN|nr:hypothetical protein [Micromonospora inositola]SCG51282.1 hypothetical protein GA0070613_2024 [Micromonospora inositola]